jgi:hypothetical protein
MSCLVCFWSARQAFADSVIQSLPIKFREEQPLRGETEKVIATLREHPQGLCSPSFSVLFPHLGIDTNLSSLPQWPTSRSKSPSQPIASTTLSPLSFAPRSFARCSRRSVVSSPLSLDIESDEADSASRSTGNHNVLLRPQQVSASVEVRMGLDGPALRRTIFSSLQYPDVIPCHLFALLQ